ncbi:hypothetical protein E1A91_A08G017200v1 [Gossypium mustelinum]|uniref:Transmembrane protein n=1 Tax=Gossypium mustelinum TaxID=34275 RepID=A0A5D2Y3U4_GOSMU|nr:hypothetical protein E1A91_A08G017200v1 [Gossypium mustelinum]
MARNYNYSSYSFIDHLSPPPLHLCFFIIILFFVLGLSWYINYESKLEDLTIQLKLFLLLVPVVLLLLVHCLSAESLDFVVPFPDQDSLHRAGGSPWRVALVLVVVIYMISYQSYFHERWFPFGIK